MPLSIKNRTFVLFCDKNYLTADTQQISTNCQSAYQPSGLL